MMKNACWQSTGTGWILQNYYRQINFNPATEVGCTCGQYKSARPGDNPFCQQRKPGEDHIDENDQTSTR
jgi:hypothetical protein